PEARNKVFYIYGNESFYMKDLLLEYGRHLNPGMKKVSVTPVALLKTIALLTGKKELKTVASMFSYFEKAKEPGNADETNALLGSPEISFKKWLELNKQYVNFKET
ncbi:MAG: hypothetical protein GXO83_01845, partial [Chlorobi bacterium]|nr:hypothetical protein [Chlorobiota bacterium]